MEFYYLISSDPFDTRLKYSSIRTDIYMYKYLYNVRVTIHCEHFEIIQISIAELSPICPFCKTFCHVFFFAY